MNRSHCAKEYCEGVEIQEDWSIIKGWREHFDRRMLEIILIPL